MKTIYNYIENTDPRHSDLIDSRAYMFACQEAKFRDEYLLLYIKKKPYWLPNFIYEWLLSKLFVLAYFKRTS